MRRFARPATLLAVIAIALAGCGGDDSETTSGASGAAGASGESSASAGASYDITVGEFIADLEDEKTAILEQYVADTPSCNADVDKGFVLTVSATATDADPDSPLADLIDRSC